MAVRSLLDELAGDWSRRGGDEVVFESVGGVDVLARVRAGEPFDIVVLAEDAIKSLAAGSLVVAATRVALARADVVIAVRAGASHPDVTSRAALRESLRSAGKIGYSTGPSGVALRPLFAACDIEPERLIQAPSGVPIAALLARGDVDIGFQQRSELIHAAGVDVIGAMPPGLEIVTTFSGAVCTGSTQQEPARAFLDFLRSGTVEAARRRHGFAAA